jgi:hypothetical protein
LCNAGETSLKRIERNPAFDKQRSQNKITAGFYKMKYPGCWVVFIFIC